MERNDEIIRRLEEHYAGARPGLHFNNAFELLIATILSAQTTDKQVNAVTPSLFKKYPDAQSFLSLSEDTLEDMIRSCGFYKSKARNILKTCAELVQKYGGKVPETREELTALAGVGRKTAGVVLSNAFGIPAIPVDTHVFRVSNRLGLADADDVLETEKQLMAAIPEDKWSAAHHWLIGHGRTVCIARTPRCGACFLQDICKWANNKEETPDVCG